MSPRCSASQIMPYAVRSLIEPPGFIPSSFTQTSAAPGSTTRCNRTIGVRPIALSIRAAVVVELSIERQSRVGSPRSAKCRRGSAEEMLDVLDGTPQPEIDDLLGRAGVVRSQH